MNEEKEQAERSSKEDIRELRRQLEDNMVALGFTPEQRNILLTTQPYKAPWLNEKLSIYDNLREKDIKHLAEVIYAKQENTAHLSLATRMEIAREVWPKLRIAVIRKFTADEAAALRAQMQPSSRAAFVTEQKRRILWPK